MVLETLQPGASVNVGQLLVEKPQDPRPETFTVERDIPQQVKAKIIAWVEKNKINNTGRNYFSKATAEAKLLYPQELQSFYLTDQEIVSVLLERSTISSGTYIDLKPLNKTAKFPREDLIGPDQALLCREYVEKRDLDRGSVASFLLRDYFAFLKIYYPHELSDLSPSPQFVSQSEESMNSIDIIDGRNLTPAVNLRVLFWPQEPPTKLSRSLWDKMRARLKELCNDALNPRDNLAIPRLINYAREMQILAADELKLSEEGVQTISYPKPEFTRLQLELPESRRY